MTDWSFDQDAAGRSRITHHTPPRFTAYWVSGPEALPVLALPYWQVPGSGDGDDRLHFFGFRWSDCPPDGEAFERLMEAAAQAVDAWIAGQL